MDKSLTHGMFSRERRDDPGKQKIDEGKDVIGMLTALEALDPYTRATG